MGLFGDELLLDINYEAFDLNKPNIQINKLKQNPEHILSFSTISILLSQLTVLSDYASSLAANVLNFIKHQKTDYSPHPENVISGFEFHLYKKSSNYIYNQFSPQLSKPFCTNNMIERDIVTIINNYIIWVFKKSNDKDSICSYLLLAINFYATNLRPVMKKNTEINPDIRGRLIKTQVDICSTIYNKWENPPINYGTNGFSEKLKETELLLSEY